MLSDFARAVGSRAHVDDLAVLSQLLSGQKGWWTGAVIAGLDEGLGIHGVDLRQDAQVVVHDPGANGVRGAVLEVGTKQAVQ